MVDLKNLERKESELKKMLSVAEVEYKTLTNEIQDLQVTLGVLQGLINLERMELEDKK